MVEFLPGELAGMHYFLRSPSPSLHGPFPLLVFLHGSGERGSRDGSDLSLVRKHGPWKSLGSEVCYILAPQCPNTQVWPSFTKEVLLLIEHICHHFPIDKSRIYGTGLSLGGFGVWSVAYASPSLFAAILPICGGFSKPLPPDSPMATLLGTAKHPPSQDARTRVGHLPTWMFHGGKDKIVDCLGSTQLFKLLGGNTRGDHILRLTIFEDQGHNVWSTAYGQHEVMAWLLSHQNEAALLPEAPIQLWKAGCSMELPEDTKRLLKALPGQGPPKRRRLSAMTSTTVAAAATNGTSAPSIMSGQSQAQQPATVAAAPAAAGRASGVKAAAAAASLLPLLRQKASSKQLQPRSGPHSLEADTGPVPIAGAIQTNDQDTAHHRLHQVALQMRAIVQEKHPSLHIVRASTTTGAAPAPWMKARDACS